MRWSEDRLADYLKRRGVPGAKNTADTSSPPFALPADKGRGRLALGRLKSGEMNKTEAAYAAHLDADPDIVWWKFEGLKLRLADKTFYSPDFFVMRRDGALEAHEVKGFWEDDARVKIKVAASLYPFRFLALQPAAKKHGGGWKVEEF